MTTATDIITAAFRESNLIPLVAAPSTAQFAEALPRLNSLVLSTVGNEAGEELTELNIGGTYTEIQTCAFAVPPNVRLVLNLSGALTLKLDPQPYDGQRLAFADAGLSLSTNNLTLDGNGRTIEAEATTVLDQAGDNGQWMYRADQADWMRLTDLDLTDDLPFPEEYDDYFIVMLAMRLNPRYGQSIDALSAAAYKRTLSQIRARYRKPRTPNDPGALGLMGQRRGYDSTSGFNSGRVW